MSVGVSVGVPVGGVSSQTLLVKVFVSRVTEPLRASARPSTVVPLFAVIDVNAMIVPTNWVLVSSVAELATCQKTLQLCAPLRREIVLFGAVIRVEPIWKMKTASGSPSASSVRVPVTPMELEAV